MAKNKLEKYGYKSVECLSKELNVKRSKLLKLIKEKSIPSLKFHIPSEGLKNIIGLDAHSEQLLVHYIAQMVI